MMECKICGIKFKNNKAGCLTKHLYDQHLITLEEYVTITEYNDIEPICACGFCNEKPLFWRGGFKRYAKGHRSQEWARKKYIELYGYPKCEFCGKETGFNRKEPKIICKSCVGKTTGFGNPEVQQKIRKNIQEKHGCDVISQLPEVKRKMSESQKGMKKKKHTQKQRGKISEASKKNGEDPEYREKTIKNIREALNTSETREARSKRAKELGKNEEYVNNVVSAISQSLGCKKSKLHKSFISYCGDLSNFGFVSEQRIGRYIVDELNQEKLIVVEIHGDYIHANPKKYKEDDIINLPGKKNGYYASQKGKKDKEKIEKLKEIGYDVIVVWESDDGNEKLNKIKSMCEAKQENKSLVDQIFG